MYIYITNEIYNTRWNFILKFLVEIQKYVISAWFVNNNNCQCMEVLYNFFRLAGTGVANVGTEVLVSYRSHKYQTTFYYFFRNKLKSSGYISIFEASRKIDVAISVGSACSQ